MNTLIAAIESHHALGTYRSLSPSGSTLDFASNDYLGLSQSKKIAKKLVEALAAGCPLGATGSRLLSGQTKYHEQVETFLAQTFGVSSALLFSSGFMANLGVLAVLASLDAEFFSDELNHASLVDGMRLSVRAKHIFRHNDLNHLEHLLSKSSSQLKVIVTESVFSMDGDISPLSELIQLADRFNGWLVVDEAHATGVFGDSSLGRLEDLTFDQERLISIHTGGKALGGQGAFVLSNHCFRELLINRARSFIFSTALAPLSALQIEYAVSEILSDSDHGATLLKTAKEWIQQIPSKFHASQSQSQIIPLIVGSNEGAMRAAAHLQAKGFDVRAVRSPTVRPGSERLRVTLKSYHQAQDLQRFIKILAEIKI